MDGATRTLNVACGRKKAESIASEKSCHLLACLLLVIKGGVDWRAATDLRDPLSVVQNLIHDGKQNVL